MSLAKVASGVLVYGFWVILIILIMRGTTVPGLMNNGVYWGVGITLLVLLVPAGGYLIKLFAVPANSTKSANTKKIKTVIPRNE